MINLKIFTIEDIEHVVTLKIHKETLRHDVKIPPNNNKDKEVCHKCILGGMNTPSNPMQVKDIDFP